MAPFEFIAVEARDQHVEIVMNRPERRNALNVAIVEELHEAIAQLERDPAVLILSGANGDFVAGADLSEMVNRDRHDALRGINLTLFDRIRKLPLPSIAAVDGYALGGGAELAYACDLRVATPRAVFGNPEANLGILAAAGAAYRLPALVGETITKEMLYLGRQLRGQEALDAGLVSRIAEPDELLDVAREMAAAMAKATPIALQLTKLAIDAPAGAHPAVELLGQALLFEDPEKVRRMTAFLEKRK